MIIISFQEKGNYFCKCSSVVKLVRTSVCHSALKEILLDSFHISHIKSGCPTKKEPQKPQGISYLERDKEGGGGRGRNGAIR
jgi:hypothetical protein